MKNTFNEITDTIIDSLLEPLRTIAAMDSLTGAADADEDAELLREKLDEALNLAKDAIIKTTVLRELYDRVK